MDKQAAGNWYEIGYTGPGKQWSSSSETSVIKYDGSTNTVWKATPVGALNDCTTDMNWTLTATVDGTMVQYVAAASAQCKALTPSWTNFSRSSKGAS